MPIIELKDGRKIEIRGEGTPEKISGLLQSIQKQSTPQPGPNVPPGVGGSAASFFPGSFGQAAKEALVTGPAKEFGRLAAGASTLGEKMILDPIQKAIRGTSPTGPTLGQQLIGGPLQARTLPEKIGGAIAQVGEFALPGEAPAKFADIAGKTAIRELPSALTAGKALLPSLVKGGVKLGARALTEAGTLAGQTAMMTGGDVEQTKKAAEIGAAFPVIGSVIGGLGKALAPAMKGVGEKILKTVVKASKKDIENGFKIENLNKYKIGGNLQTMLSQTATHLNGLYENLTARLATAPKTVNISLNQAVKQTIDALQKDIGSTFGKNLGIERAIEELKDEVAFVSKKSPFVDLVKATDIKRGAGTKGAWLNKMTDPDADAKETVYSLFYNKLKTAIEDAGERAGIPDIKDINRKMSELIPIQAALIRRIPVAERNDAIGLLRTMEMLGTVFNPKAAALLGVHEALRSGRVGSPLIKGSERLMEGPKGAIGKRFFGMPPIGTGP